jgi:hypothetical protein
VVRITVVSAGAAISGVGSFRASPGGMVAGAKSGLPGIAVFDFLHPALITIAAGISMASSFHLPPGIVGIAFHAGMLIHFVFSAVKVLSPPTAFKSPIPPLDFGHINFVTKAVRSSLARHPNVTYSAGPVFPPDSPL